MSFPVFLDTCTLFGQAVCDLLLSLAEQDCFTPYWSRNVLDSMERNVVERGKASPGAIHRRRLMMEAAFPDSIVDGYEGLIGSMTNHPGDRHVLAACVVSPAHTLATFNVKDFPAASVDPHDVEVVHPDLFLLDQFDLHPDRSREAVTMLLARNRRPPHDVEALAVVLAASGLPLTAASIRRLAV